MLLFTSLFLLYNFVYTYFVIIFRNDGLLIRDILKRSFALSHIYFAFQNSWKNAKNNLATMIFILDFSYTLSFSLHFITEAIRATFQPENEQKEELLF